MINSINIKNFRGIKKGQIKDFAKFNLLIGDNNTGKSSILETIYLSATASKSANLDNIGKIMLSDSDYMGYNSFIRVHEKHAMPEKKLNECYEGEIIIKIGSGDNPFYGYKISDKPANFTEEDAKKTGLFIINLKDRKSNEKIKKIKNLIEEEKITSKNSHLTFLWDPDMTYNYAGTAGWLIEGKVTEKVLFYDIQLVFQHLPLSVGRRMLKEIPAWTKEVYKYFARILNLPEDGNLSYIPLENNTEYLQPYIAIQDNPALPLDSFGDGARLVFKVLAPLVALAKDINREKSGLFLWEEPELFQNPVTLYKLLETVVNLTRDKNIQIFITTQSIEVIACFTDLIHRKTIDENDIKAYQLNLSDGELKTAWFTGENLLVWLRNGFDPRIWAKFKSPLSYKLRVSEEEGEEEC